MTEPLFRSDAYAREAPAVVIDAAPGRIVLDVSLFYPRGGGQPGDRGSLLRADGAAVDIVDTLYDVDRKTILLVPAEGARVLSPGERLTARLDWAVRYARMRAHTALHLLSVVLPFPVTGGSVGDAINELVATDAAVSTRWIADAELEANPGLVKTMKVKPPMGTGRVRLVEIAGLDLQPCGGTHVARLSEIGRIEVTGIEKKGKLNRRVRIRLPDPAPAG